MILFPPSDSIILNVQDWPLLVRLLTICFDYAIATKIKWMNLSLKWQLYTMKVPLYTTKFSSSVFIFCKAKRRKKLIIRNQHVEKFQFTISNWFLLIIILEFVVWMRHLSQFLRNAKETIISIANEEGNMTAIKTIHQQHEIDNKNSHNKNQAAKRKLNALRIAS